MIIFGAGGHGKVVLALLVDQSIPVDFILDDDEQIESFCGHEVKNAKDFSTLNEYQFITVNNVKQSLSKVYLSKISPQK